MGNVDMLTSINIRTVERRAVSTRPWVRALNSRWHRTAMLIFVAIVLSHWAEHVFQVIQIFVLGWPRDQALGALGLVFPWLVRSEELHYWYAAAMLVGLILLRPGIGRRARVWWDAALIIQIWHHFEHLLLLSQVILGANLFGAPAPTSILQLVFPRVELHLFYNAMVTMPMLVAMYIHLHPTARERKLANCTCAGPSPSYRRQPRAA
jgi:hypothetical protein